MNIRSDWIVLDTNIWIFGLRNQPDQPECARLLRCLSRLYVKIPRQVLLELRANLNEEEMNELFRLLSYYPDRVDIRWGKADMALVDKYQQMGCKLGDAAVAAHVEALDIKILVTENRDFLEEIKGLPFQVLRAKDILRESGESK